MRERGCTLWLILISFTCLSQEPIYQWVKQFKPIEGYSAFSEFSNIIAIEQDVNKNLVVLGYYDFDSIVLDSSSSGGVSGNSSVNGTKAFVAKFTRNGNIIWHKSIEGISGQFFSVAELSDLKLGTDGSLVFGGHFYGSVDFDPGVEQYVLTNTNSGGAKFVLKLNIDGNFQWVQLLNPDTSHSLHSGFYLDINDIELDLDNNVYLTGPVNGVWDVDPDSLDTFYIPDYHLGQDGYLLKLSSGGDFVWCKVFGTSGQYHPDNAHMIKRGLDNDLYFGCSYLDSIVVNVDGQDVLLNHPPGVSSNDLDYFMAKMDTSGQFEWVTQLVGYGGQWIREVEVDSNGEIYACGSFLGSVTLYPFVADTYVSSQYNSTLQQHFADALVIKYTSNGDPIWGRVVTSPYIDSFDEIELDSNSLYLGGVTGDSVYVGTDFMGYLEAISISNSNHYRGTILQMSKSGTTGWMQRFESNSSAVLNDLLVDGNEIFSVGGFAYETDFDLSEDGYVYVNTGLPFKTNGFLHKMIFTADTFGLAEHSVYPNPFIDFVNLYAKDFENTHTRIVDMQGRLIREPTLESKLTTIDLSQEASGVYFLLIENGEKREIIRIVKQ